MLPAVLNKYSKVPALYAVNDTPILPTRIYLAPPGKHLHVDRDRVRLSMGPRENRHRPSADVLFRSAALAYGPRVIGIVLTGNLDDGAAGLVTIKDRGGLAMVQDPEDALAPSMPRSALELAEPDYVLPVEEIGPKLAALVMTDEAAPKSRQPKLVGIKRTNASFPCPECGGVLNDFQEGETTRFRCRVGHTYSPQSLFEDQSLALERALWAAIRSLEEHAEFASRLASKSVSNDRPRASKRFEERARASREHASILRELLDHGEDAGQPTPQEEATGTE